MRASISVAVLLSACFTVVSALPQSGVELRATRLEARKKPAYSVVPLEPGKSNGGGSGGGNGGGNGGGGGGGDGDEDTVTVIKTVVKTKDPVTVTRSIPTTIISIIDIDGDATKTVTVTPSVTVTASEVSTTPHVSTTSTETKKQTTTTVYPSAPGKPTTSFTMTFTRPTTANGTLPWSYATTTTAPTTLETISTLTSVHTSSSSSSSTTHDNGLWHTTYPSWNGTVARRFRI